MLYFFLATSVYIFADHPLLAQHVKQLTLSASAGASFKPLLPFALFDLGFCETLAATRQFSFSQHSFHKPFLVSQLFFTVAKKQDGADILDSLVS